MVLNRSESKGSVAWQEVRSALPCEIFEHIKFTFEIYNIDVVTYKSRNPWSKANGYTKKRKPFKIHVNTRKINKRSVDSWVGFLIHETCHLAGYSHGSNSPKGKESSVPYKVGSIAKRMAGELSSQH